MPYKNIVFVKLEKRLLNDPRWWTMSDQAQLIYVKVILLAAETYNKIPLNDNVLREAIRCKLELKDFQKCLEEIEKNFPKLKKNKHYRYFGEFETKTNYIPKREIPRKSQGLPKVGADKEEDKDIDKEKDKDKDIKPQGEKPPAENDLLNTELQKVFKDGFNIYALINKVKKESKVGAEIPREVLSKLCTRYWEDKASIKDAWPWFIAVLRREWELFNHEGFKKEGMPELLKSILGMR